MKKQVSINFRTQVQVDTEIDVEATMEMDDTEKRLLLADLFDGSSGHRASLATCNDRDIAEILNIEFEE